ncbi:MAG: hypothetical protein U5O39_11760 [Gammaproteobacteria bacterium]|nr:hypothetical protein [Gammaproteobacteria bacterium]
MIIHELRIRLFNDGFLDVQASGALRLDDGTFSYYNCGINVASGAILTIDGDIDGGVVRIGQGTSFSGTGTIDLLGNVTFEVQDSSFFDFTGVWEPNDAQATYLTSTTTTSQFTIVPGATFVLDSADNVGPNVDMFNEGTLTLTGNKVTVGGSFFNDFDGVLNLTGGVPAPKSSRVLTTMARSILTSLTVMRAIRWMSTPASRNARFPG